MNVNLLNVKSWTAITAGTLGGLAAASCCILPLAFLWLGVSGAWIANLTALAPYHGFFILFAVCSVGVGFYYYRRNQLADYGPGDACARPLPNGMVRYSLYLTTALVIIAALFPYLAQFLLGD